VEQEFLVEMDRTNWDNERRRFVERVEARETEPSAHFSSRNGSTLLAVSSFDAYDGEFEVSPYLSVVHCLRGSGRFLRAGDWGSVDGVLRPGASALAMPGSRATGHTPRARLLGLGIDPGRAACGLADLGGMSALSPAAAALIEDKLIAAVLVALWRDAEVHGLSSAFFDHGVDLVLRRLVAADRGSRPARPARVLTRRQLRRAVELIDSRIASDLRVEDIAREIGRDVRSITRAFRATTGYAPFEFLTLRRMERAKEMLRTTATIMEISLAVGYSNPAKFAAAFRRIFSCSPSEWRRGLD